MAETKMLLCVLARRAGRDGAKWPAVVRGDLDASVERPALLPKGGLRLRFA